MPMSGAVLSYCSIVLVDFTETRILVAIEMGHIRCKFGAADSVQLSSTRARRVRDADEQ